MIIASIGRTTQREYFKKNQGQMVLELKLLIQEATKKGYTEATVGDCIDLTFVIQILNEDA